MNQHAENLLVHFRRIEDIKREALDLPSVDLDQRRLHDLEMLINRAFYPLQGYLRRADYESVLDNMRLANGSLWPMPITLDIDEKTAQSITPGSRLALRDQEGFLVAVLNVADIWQADKTREAMAVYGTDDPQAHPGVRRLFEETGQFYAGGAIEGVHPPIHYDFRELRLTPAEIHRQFSRNGWRNVIALHTSGFLHRAHREMAMRAARAANANILLHPTSGGLRHPGDAGHFTRINCWKAFAENFPRNMIMLGLTGIAARWAGPREALWHAIIRKNYGCSHIMISGDHADPFEGAEDGRRFYERGKAREMVRSFEPETGIGMIAADEMLYVEEMADFIPADSVKPEMTIRRISDSELIRRLEKGLDIPEWFSYASIIDELRLAHPQRSRQGFTIFMTGLSGSGKSTLASVLMVKFMEMRGRPVTLLDGDIVRKNLSSELNFSKEHRNLNVTRIGFVASEITKNGGIAICAPIAPYEESRRHNRELIGRHGGFVEVYVATPIEVCEQRDRKGLYAKARAGKVLGVTGVSDPYIPPSNPEITIDTSTMNPEEAAQQVLLYLAEEGYIS
jgi:sulfate adenylyltransferase